MLSNLFTVEYQKRELGQIIKLPPREAAGYRINDPMATLFMDLRWWGDALSSSRCSCTQSLYWSVFMAFGLLCVSHMRATLPDGQWLCVWCVLCVCLLVGLWWWSMRRRHGQRDIMRSDATMSMTKATWVANHIIRLREGDNQFSSTVCVCACVKCARLGLMSTKPWWTVTMNLCDHTCAPRPLPTTCPTHIVIQAAAHGAECAKGRQ